MNILSAAATILLSLSHPDGIYQVGDTVKVYASLGDKTELVHSEVACEGPENRIFDYEDTQIGWVVAPQDYVQGAASTGLMTKNLTAMLRQHYDSANPKPAATWDAYLNSLKSPAYLENLKASVMEGMVDEPYTPWTMKSVKDTEVSSASFGKDDIIVLDFWATWCAPCIAALEGMQMAVNKYKNDPHVHFYFVDTQDVPDDKQGPTRVWKRKGYSFDDMLVLFDNTTPGKKNMNLVYKTMFHGTSGIPQKAILKNGRLRYRAEGYGGSPSGLEDEIAAVIDILKAEGNE